jgi:hypothetical protein
MPGGEAGMWCYANPEPLRSFLRVQELPAMRFQTIALLHGAPAGLILQGLYPDFS